ncbi:hypothetical protein ACIBM3_33510, partial [Rhodococcus erythropolis]
MSLLDDLRLERPFPITVATRLGSIIAVMNRENAATIRHCHVVERGELGEYVVTTPTLSYKGHRYPVEI